MFLLFTVFSVITVSPAQQASTTAVPNLINYSGTLVLSGGPGEPGKTIGVTFAIYRQEDGGAPIWLETQNVTPDSIGHYTVLLGSTRAEGIAADLFSTQEQRWLGVQVQGEAEQPRVLLVSVPYALKAADAETIGGLPASAFVLAPPNANPAIATTGGEAPGSASPSTSSNVTTTGGTANTIPMFTTSTNIQNSILTQTGTTAVNVVGKLNLPATGTATASEGFNSRPVAFVASVFNSGTSTAVAQTFQLQAEPISNDKTTASGTLNLLFGQGTSMPTETGFKISNKGIITFAAGQTLPMVTGNITDTGNISATGRLISTVATGTAPLSVNSVTQVANLNATFLGGFSSDAFARTGIQNVFVADQFIAGNAAHIYLGDPQCGSGYAGIGFNGLTGCNNYSMIGNGVDTYLNRPSGGTMHFRENNGEQVTIASGGQVGIGTENPGGMLEADAPLEVGLAAGFFVGSSSNGGALGGRGVTAIGGDSVSNSGGDGIDAFAGRGSTNGAAGFFTGDVNVTGNLTKGGGSFKIDHPLDPANKYLYHSFVESPDMKNIYDGVATLDANGEAVIQMAEWFGVLNRDFRYQLTCIGGFAPVYIAEEISNNQFKIAGGKSGMKISWQVTGIRQDGWANAHRIPVEEEKNARERGYYLHPELYGAPEEKGIAWARHPDLMKRMKQRPVPAHPANNFVGQAQTLQASK
jgi:hypothetical protein